ncbi:hypothetical protein BJ138DRAFT_1172309 [Hygrophoropsis aurantiaca]|uniref:Uncharacterized protein n=1 Tax=Hygrophoropsis aurantiaca TaxID=72124 RepID=A0ACB8AE72_9AGAM|nr:hypothetical protein BJ138DRAFT_1172309 [Hygrophoropsis aurantiaca]
MSTASTSAIITSGSRSRPQARKKPNDDAAYFGPPTTGTKRAAVDRAEGEPRVKRKRVDNPSAHTQAHPHASTHARKAEKTAGGGMLGGLDAEEKSLVEFKNMPTAALHRYLSHFNLIPMIHPSPLCAADPPPPSYLQDPLHYAHAHSPVVLPTIANRPRRDPKDHSRRRSSRLLDDPYPHRTPILADIADVHAVLAEMAERHFLEHVVSEIDTLAAFMVKTKCE